MLVASCARLKDKNVHTKDLIIWDQERTYKTTKVNDLIRIHYKTCFDSKDKKYDFWESLRVQFKKKFQVELIGLSEAESRSFYNENDVCLLISGYPVTVKEFKTDHKGVVEFIDPHQS